ncbi:MAG: hypothetical protein L0Z50_31470 [Verrucomicrobiales bacterium]|nr:hypothetical protein [Verrucomicrobiales bacterium]
MKTQPPLTTLRELALVAVFALAVVPPLGAEDCPPFANVDWSRTSVGLPPLTDLGAGFYNGQQGGLYPGGSNLRPPAHEIAGLALARSVEPLDAAGQPDPNGKLVLLSIGMSNPSLEFATFMPLADADSLRHPQLVLVNGAQGGQQARDWAENSLTNGKPWGKLSETLDRAGVTTNQVSVVWIKLANGFPTGTNFADALLLKNYLITIVQRLKAKFPNLKLAYLSSRIYAGYSTTGEQPEPYAYEEAFSFKWLIEDQLNGAAALNYDPVRGPVLAPWLAWGPYLWADGLTPRSDGLVWTCEDFIRTDGQPTDAIHPGGVGRAKIANLLLNFFKTDTTGREWFLADWAVTPIDIVQAELNPITGHFLLSWTTLPAAKYQVQHSPDLAAWSNAGPPLTAVTNLLSWTDDGTQTGTPPSQATWRYYRVQVLP